MRGAGLQPGDGFLGTNLSFGEVVTKAAIGARWLPETVGRSVAQEIQDHGSFTVDAGFYFYGGGNVTLSIDFDGIHGSFALGGGMGGHIVAGATYDIPPHNLPQSHADNLFSGFYGDLSYGNGVWGGSGSLGGTGIQFTGGYGIGTSASVNYQLFSGSLIDF